jgi:hypothetical protein
VLTGGMAAAWPAAHRPMIVRVGRAVRSACLPAVVTLSHVAEHEVEGFESGEASQFAQPLVGDVAAAS